MDTKGKRRGASAFTGVPVSGPVKKCEGCGLEAIYRRVRCCGCKRLFCRRKSHGLFGVADGRRTNWFECWECQKEREAAAARRAR